MIQVRPKPAYLALLSRETRTRRLVLCVATFPLVWSSFDDTIILCSGTMVVSRDRTTVPCCETNLGVFIHTHIVKIKLVGVAVQTRGVSTWSLLQKLQQRCIPSV
jgi:hypothetical protein